MKNWTFTWRGKNVWIKECKKIMNLKKWWKFESHTDKFKMKKNLELKVDQLTTTMAIN